MEFRRYWEILIKWKWYFIRSVLLIFIVSLFLICFSKPIYKTSAKVMINARNLQVDFISNLPANLGQLSFLEARNVPDTYLSLFNISPILAKVIQELDLRDSKGKTINFKDLQISIFKIPSMILRQKKGIKIKQIGASETLEITGYSDDRDQAVKITNTVAKTFLDFLGNIHKEEATAARLILEQQLLNSEKRLQLAEKALERYKIKNKATNITEQSENLVTSVYDLKTQKGNTERSLTETISQLSSIKKKLSTEPEFYKSEEILEINPTIKEHKNALRSLKTQLARHSTELTPAHPEVKATLAQIDAIEKIIKEEILKTFSSETMARNPYYRTLVERYGDREIDVLTYSVRKELLDKAIKEKYKELGNIAKKERGLNRLTREVDILNTQYRAIKTSLESAKTAENINIANAVIIQPASTSSTVKKDIYFPRKKLGLIASLALGSLFGFLLVLFLEYTDNKIRTIKDLTQAITLPICRVIPRVRAQILKENSSSKFDDHFWNIKTHLDLSISTKETCRVIAILSTSRGEGKTVVSKHLAMIIAEAGQKVLLVDSNLRNPSLHKLFGLSNSIGLVDYFEGKRELQEIILPTHQERLKTILCGTVYSNPLKIIHPFKLSELIQKVKTEFDCVVFDTAAVHDGNDAFVISSFADCILLVVASGYISDTELQKTLKALQNINPSYAGIIFNKAILI